MIFLFCLYCWADKFTNVSRGTNQKKTKPNFKNMSIEKIAAVVRNIPDFPVKGIQFKDITTIFQSAERLKELSDILYERYKDKGITKVIGIESRGFFMGPDLAIKLNAGFVPMRKPGKLPYKVIEEKYTKEYGEDAIQIHEDALSEDDVVLIHDDLLATGGTMLAAYKLVKKLKVKKVYINFIIELEEFNARKLFPDDVELDTVLKYKI